MCFVRYTNPYCKIRNIVTADLRKIYAWGHWYTWFSPKGGIWKMRMPAEFDSVYLVKYSVQTTVFSVKAHLNTYLICKGYVLVYWINVHICLATTEPHMLMFFLLCPCVSACITPFTQLEAAYLIWAAPLAAILNQSKELFLFESFLCYPKSRLVSVSGLLFPSMLWNSVIFLSIFFTHLLSKPSSPLRFSPLTETCLYRVNLPLINVSLYTSLGVLEKHFGKYEEQI